VAYVAEKVMPSLGLIHFPKNDWTGLEFIIAINWSIHMEITTFGRNTLQRSKGQFSIKIAYYLSAFLVCVMWCVGISPSIANGNNASASGNNAASSSIQSATQTTSNALNSVILSNTMGGSGGFKLKLGSSPQFNHFSVLDNSNDNQISGTQSSREESGQGGIAASPDFSNWSIWATPVVSGFKNNIAPYTSNGTVSIALMGLEYNYDDTIISGLSYAYSSVNANTTYNGGTLKSVSKTISPYLVYILNDRWMFDTSAGFGQATPETNVSGVTGKTSSQSFFATVGATNTIEMGKVLVRPRASYTVYKDYLAGYINSANTANAPLTSWLYQTKLGGTVSYEAKPFSPFISAYSIFNNWSMTPSTTAPSAYPSTYQVQIGANASKGPFYGTAAFQFQKSTSQFTIYGGIRF
jgi:hypothetical protein